MYNCTYSTDIFVTLRAKLKMVDFFEPLSFIKQVNSCGLKEAGRWQIAGDSIGTYQSYLHTYSLHIWWLFTVVTPSACFIYLVGGVVGNKHGGLEDQAGFHDDGFETHKRENFFYLLFDFINFGKLSHFLRIFTISISTASTVGLFLFGFRTRKLYLLS